MATIDSKEFIDNIIKHNGWTDEHDHDAPDNPRAHSIVEFTNAFGKRVYGVSFAYEGDPDRYLVETEYVRDPKVIWTAAEHPLADDIEEP